MVTLGAEILNDLLAPKQVRATTGFGSLANENEIKQQSERVDVADSLLNNLENIDAEEEII